MPGYVFRRWKSCHFESKQQEVGMAGRPSELENIDFAQVELMGKFRATHETMAEHFGVCVRTIERYMADEEGEFCRVYKKAFSECKMKLSEAQMKSALEGNATMLVWLGKQHLGQKDKQEIKTDLTVSGAPLINFGDTSKKE